MALFPRGVPRRATLGALVGTVYACLLLLAMPMDSFPLVPLALATGWFLLSVGLLFLQPMSFTAFTAYAILWIVWRAVVYARNVATVGFLEFFVNDALLPLLALVLVGSSGYMAAAHHARDAEA